MNPNNICECLGMRNVIESLSASGVEINGANLLSAADRQAFANQLDRWLAR